MVTMAEYIDKAVVKERLERVFKLQAKTAKKLVDDMPVEDVKPVLHGEWVENPDETFASTFHCSECGEYPLFYDNEYCFSNFCPNCGADMRGGKDNG